MPLGATLVTYFDRDAKFVGAAARNDPWVFLRVVLMVLLSIRQPWLKIPQQFHSVMERGAESPYLFGFKRTGYMTTLTRLQEFHGAVKNYDGDLDALILKLMEIPGLGLAKASFVAQLTVGDGACLDSHNLSRMGKDASFTRISKTSSNLPQRIAEYNAAWREVGDSAYWWDSWCELISARYKIISPADVSALHRLPVL